MFKNSVSLLLIAFVIGFVAGCGGSNPLADDAQSAIEGQNYQAALESAKQAIEEYPQDPLGYYYKAVALGNLADEYPADERQSYYERMNESFEKAREVASQLENPDDVPDEMSRVDFVKNAVWRTEHNQAIAYVTEDSLMNVTENPYEMAISHLQNATTVWPDSMLSWDVMSQIYATQSNFTRAAEIQEKVINSSYWEADTTDYAQLGQYLYQANETERAIAALERGQQQFPESTQIRQVLADLYMQSGQSQQAINMVRDLVEDDPDNMQYRIALGAQIYQAALAYSDSLDANVEEIYNIEQQARTGEIPQEEANQQIAEIKEENDQLREELVTRSEQAIEQLETVTNNQPQNAQAYDYLGIIYQNWGLTVFDQRNLTEDNEEAARLDKRADELLTQAMENYEQVVQIEPDNIDAWKALYNIYINLGMDEEAQQAAEKAGLGGNGGGGN
ncbi:MAG: tetratricopeptide repeat protein [Balneolaceae bacterium]|nr:tetratricopeptide repeat protein [Balneolaceae bacterium]